MDRNFSFRGHKAAIACIGSFQNDVVSADRDGFVAVWDVFLKRPKAVWKAHDGHVVSLQSTPLGLLTQGRDSNIRIWKAPFTGISSSFPLEAHAASDLEPNSRMPSCFEIPVNSLNFCNVAYCGGLLATPATRDSENFDIYAVLDDFSLLRVVENFGTDGPANSDGKRAGSGIIMRLLFVDELLLFAGYESGCVKAFRIKRDSVSVVARNDHFMMNKPAKVTVVMDEDAHTPHPVLSLDYDPATCRLYSGSASKKLMVYSVGHLVDNKGKIDGSSAQERHGGNKSKENGENGENGVGGDVHTKSVLLTENSSGTHQGILGATSHPRGINGLENSETSEGSNNIHADHIAIDIQSYNLHHYGIQNLQAGKLLAAGFWDGTVAVLDHNMNVLSEFCRTEEVIQPESEDQAKTSKKSLSLYMWQHEKQENDGSRKALMRERRVPGGQLLFVGYGDGLISAYGMGQWSS